MLDIFQSFSWHSHHNVYRTFIFIFLLRENTTLYKQKQLNLPSDEPNISTSTWFGATGSLYFVFSWPVFELCCFLRGFGVVWMNGVGVVVGGFGGSLSSKFEI